MSIDRGTRIGPYEVVAQIGGGGMGEVYRAHDTKLGREVALKVLPAAVAADPDRIARLRQEARALAALNHPHIATIYGIEESNGQVALVLELVEGATLSDRLAAGRLPYAAVLKIARQIAEGLEAAHQKGILHRDLKPANVKVTTDDVVKILDFGIAKALVATNTQSSQALTVGAQDTRDGLVLGTMGYMSPEQSRGHLVDRRTDIWAFGCVLFEMLAGAPAFARVTAPDTIAAIVNSEPEWKRLPADTPEGIRRLLKRCLQKDAKQRLHDIADARIELEEVAEEPAPSTVRLSRSRRLVPWGAALAATAALVSLSIALVGPRSGTSAPTAALDGRFVRLTDLPGLEEAPAISPDGRSVAFTAGVDGKRQLFVQLVAGGAPLPITRDPVDHEFPRWSPDSSSLFYFSPATPGQVQGNIWQVPALGGAPRRVTESVGGGDVNQTDGRLAFFRLAEDGIELVTAPADVSRVDVVARFPPVTYYLYPRWSPDGRWIAFQRGDSIRFDLFVVSAAGGEPRQLTQENTMMNGLAWMPDSTAIIYSSSRGNTMPYLPTAGLWTVTLSGGRVQHVISGEASFLHPDVSKTGAVVVDRRRLQSDIWRFPVDGSPTENVLRGIRVTRQTGQVLTPTVGRDDTQVAFLSDSGGHANLWIVNTVSAERRQVTHESDPNIAIGVAVWSPQGASIAFVSSRGNQGLAFGVWLVDSDGSNLRNIANPALGPGWSNDGQWLYYSTRGRGGTSDSGAVLQKVPAEGGTAVTVVTEPVRNAIGSDGTTLYYLSERPLVDGTPSFEIRAASPETAPFRVVARIPASRVPIWQIVNPTLSPDGQSLALALTDGQTTNIWALSTTTGEERQITDFGDRPIFIARRVSWSADGRSILAAVGEGDSDIVLLEGAASVGVQ